ncbi:Uncharacterized protein dnm_051210 [Desulfonema magnum]|uniref:Uncharacterized protein n=1 Tax=Desulfonema magnum TaxID=45655 RepID=A0A975BPP7_9BACT|nr:Uncharacterized protein dnm_051210 [Desulfonema magnum]
MIIHNTLHCNLCFLSFLCAWNIGYKISQICKIFKISGTFVNKIFIA